MVVALASWSLRLPRPCTSITSAPGASVRAHWESRLGPRAPSRSLAPVVLHSCAERDRTPGLHVPWAWTPGSMFGMSPAARGTGGSMMAPWWSRGVSHRSFGEGEGESRKRGFPGSLSADPWEIRIGRERVGVVRPCRLAHRRVTQNQRHGVSLVREHLLRDQRLLGGLLHDDRAVVPLERGIRGAMCE